MKSKEKNFEFPRGNTCPVKFGLVDSEENPFELAEGDQIWFTIKKFDTLTEFLVQKKLSEGDFTIEENELTFVLNQEDTAELDFGDYTYDIKFKNEEENYVKTLITGVITLTTETTWIANE